MNLFPILLLNNSGALLDIAHTLNPQVVEVVAELRVQSDAEVVEHNVVRLLSVRADVNVPAIQKAHVLVVPHLL